MPDSSTQETLSASWDDLNTDDDNPPLGQGPDEEGEYDKLEDITPGHTSEDALSKQSKEKLDTDTMTTTNDTAPPDRSSNALESCTISEPGSEEYKAAQEERRLQLIREGASSVVADHALKNNPYKPYSITNRSDRRSRNSGGMGRPIKAQRPRATRPPSVA